MKFSAKHNPDSIELYHSEAVDGVVPDTVLVFLEGEETGFPWSYGNLRSAGPGDVEVSSDGKLISLDDPVVE